MYAHVHGVDLSSFVEVELEHSLEAQSGLRPI